MIKLKVYFILFMVLIMASCRSNKEIAKLKDEVRVYRSLTAEEQRKFDHYFIEANRYKMKNDIERASKTLRECIKIDPNSSASYFELGKLYLAAQDVENALNYIKEAADLNPENEWYRYYLAGIYEQNKNTDKAIEEYKTLAKQFPAKLEYQYRVGVLLTQEKKYLDAIKVYDIIEESTGISEPLSLEKHNLYIQNKDRKNGIKEIEKLRNHYPNQPRYHVLLGDAFVDANNLKSALKAYKKAQSLDPEYGPVHMSLAGYYDIKGDQKAAKEELVLAFNSHTIPFETKLRILVQYMLQTTKDSTKMPYFGELVSNMLEQYPDEPDLHYYYGNYLLTENQKEEAVAQFKQVVELDASRYETWLQIAAYYFEKENWEQVLKTTQNAVDSEPTLPQGYMYKGIAAFQMEDYRTALNAFLKGAIYSSDNKELMGSFYANIGDAYYKLGEEDSAFEHYEKALEIDDHNIMVLNNYSYYLSLNNQNLEKAAAMSAKCVEIEPGNSTYLDTYAWVLFKMQNYSLASFYIQQAIDNLKEENAEVFEHYGDIQYMNGNYDVALVWWKKAQEVGSDSETLRKKVKTGKIDIIEN